LHHGCLGRLRVGLCARRHRGILAANLLSALVG
jgi:hypothetical protein